MRDPVDGSGDAAADCPRCGKPAALCVCAEIVPLENRVRLVILQHPQEQDRALGTARLAALHLTRAELKIGLSWPSLARLLGHPAEPLRWAVLYLGSSRPQGQAREILVLDRHGTPLAEDAAAAALASLEGIILLDGTWSQAKALWWRNPWMLKCRRLVLNPRHPSLYGALRREPRREALATIEAAALLLARLEGRPEIEAALGASFKLLLARYRAAAPRPARRDRRRR